MSGRLPLAAMVLALLAAAFPAAGEGLVQTFAVPAGSGAHDVWPAPDGSVWYTAQSAGKLGRLDPKTGKVEEIPLGPGSAPHGVIVGPDGAAWVTDGGQNAIVRVDAATRAVKVFPLPKKAPNANLNTASFDGRGVLWFTGQNGYYGWLDPASGGIAVFDAPRGTGPYGIATTPGGDVYYASLAGSYLGRIDTGTAAASVIEPPVARQGARRVWSDSQGGLWVSGWSSGHIFRYDPKVNGWRVWRVPGDRPQPYAIYVDENDIVWISDWGANALASFDPKTEKFDRIPLLDAYASVRQIAGRKGEVWAAESGADKLIVVKTK